MHPQHHHLFHQQLQALQHFQAFQHSAPISAHHVSQHLNEQHLNNMPLAGHTTPDYSTGTSRAMHPKISNDIDTSTNDHHHLHHHHQHHNLLRHHQQQQHQQPTLSSPSSAASCSLSSPSSSSSSSSSSSPLSSAVAAATTTSTATTKPTAAGAATITTTNHLNRVRNHSSSTSSRGIGKSKRIRTIFTPEQLKRLEQEFTNQMYLVGHDRCLLADSLNLTEAQVKVWFQNRRIKFRKLNPGPVNISGSHSDQMSDEDHHHHQQQQQQQQQQPNQHHQHHHHHQQQFHGHDCYLPDESMISVTSIIREDYDSSNNNIDS